MFGFAPSAPISLDGTPQAKVVEVNGEAVYDDGLAPVAIVPTTTAVAVPDADACTEWLQSEVGLPLGLAERVLESCAEFEERIWIIDNSGSMATSDGHRLARGGGGGAPRLVGCSRWDELKQSLEWHANLAAKLRSPTTFLCLNPPAGAPQEVRVGHGDADAELAAMRELLASSPTG